MTNAAYPKGSEKILSGAVNLPTDTIKACLLPTGYTFSTSHEFLAALGSTIGTAQTLTNKSVAGGVFDADDLNFGALAPGNTVKAVVIYKDTGNAATSPVLWYFDVLTGLPMATNGGTLTIPWDNGVKKICRLKLPFYPLGGQKVFSGAINLPTDTIKAVLVPSTYVYDAGHEFLTSLGTVIGTAVTLAGKTVAGGVFDANDAAFGALAGGSTIGYIVVYKDTGTAATSPLLLYIDDTAGLPQATNGSTVTHEWSSGASKIVSING